jgi:hypothetical protein
VTRGGGGASYRGGSRCSRRARCRCGRRASSPTAPRGETAAPSSSSSSSPLRRPGSRLLLRSSWPGHRGRRAGGDLQPAASCYTLSHHITWRRKEPDHRDASEKVKRRCRGPVVSRQRLPCMRVRNGRSRSSVFDLGGWASFQW